MAAEGQKVQSRMIARSRAKRPKFGNKKIEYQGMKFDSKKEFQRYLQLVEFEKNGQISDLELQVYFELAPSVRFTAEPRAKPALRYVADFVYMLEGHKVVEDVKSKITREDAVYRIKKHLMKSVHGIEILEI